MREMRKTGFPRHPSAVHKRCKCMKWADQTNPFKKWYPNENRPPHQATCSLAYDQSARSEHRIEGHRDQPVALAILLDMADGREREVEADHRRLLGGCHVVELVPGLLRQFRIEVVGDVPIRIAQEKFRNIGDVGLDQDL